MSDPNSLGNISVTIKGDGKDATWIVFHGTPARVREQIGEVFGINTDGQLYELVFAATNAYKAMGNVVQKLGGTFVKEEAAKAEPTEDEHIKALIESATTVAELTDIWVRYQSKIQGTPLFDIMGKRSAELG